MHHQRFISVFKKIQSTPTAPFHEYHVAAVLRELLADLPHVSVESDDYGNLIARYRRGRKKAHLAFAAHMDHPGWVKYKGEEEFLGGFPKERLDEHPVEWFGPFGMWQLEPFEIRDGQIHSRVCDDLIGCAAIVALFMELEEAEVETDVYGLFTRAEEVGFNGAVQMARQWPLPDGVRFVSLECSAPRGGAEMGQGPVIRVGDAMSVFDDAVTAELVDAGKEEKIPYQRALLDGGSCEATAMNVYGVPAAGISVLLGNYHNIKEKKGAGEEYVSLADAKNMVKLIVATTIRMARPSSESSKVAMKKRLETRVKDHRKYHRDAQRYWDQE